MFLTRLFPGNPLPRAGTWLAGACLVLAAACGGERSETAATAAVQELAAPSAEGEIVTLRIPASAKPQTVAPGQACGTAAKGGTQPVCEAGSYCAQATGASAGACVAAPGAPRNDG